LIYVNALPTVIIHILTTKARNVSKNSERRNMNLSRINECVQSIKLMHVTQTLHPPGGATALIAVIGSEKIHELGLMKKYYQQILQNYREEIRSAR